ncbi:MAG: hypothetical protein LBU25_10725 [Treponema sp.]|jgi:hypothetical protein|nr:hypothetical protein [Treponema sp.]
MGENARYEPRRGLTFEDVWAALMELKEYQQETARLFRESREETERSLRESREETERSLRESREETERFFRESGEKFERELEKTVQALQESHQKTEHELEKTTQALQQSHQKTERVVRELSKEVGGISNRLGEVAQCFFGSDLWRHFDGFEYEFQRLYPYLPLFDEHNRSLGDVDITLLNGEYAMAIEVKSHVKKKHVEYHVKRLEQIKQYPPDQYQGRKVVGGIAGLMIDRDAKDLADELGIYVLEQSGDAVRLAERPEWFKAREW